MNRYLSDPLYYAESFWDLPTDYLERVLESLQSIEQDRIQSESITVAHAVDAIYLAFCGNSYKSNPALFLPGYSAAKNQTTQVTSSDSITLQKTGTHFFTPDPETLAILLEEIKCQRVPGAVVANYAAHIPEWIKFLDQIDEKIKK